VSCHIVPKVQTEEGAKITGPKKLGAKVGEQRCLVDLE
jgi:hypothetical protein